METMKGKKSPAWWLFEHHLLHGDHLHHSSVPGFTVEEYSQLSENKKDEMSEELCSRWKFQDSTFYYFIFSARVTKSWVKHSNQNYSTTWWGTVPAEKGRKAKENNEDSNRAVKVSDDLNPRDTSGWKISDIKMLNLEELDNEKIASYMKRPGCPPEVYVAYFKRKR